MKTIIIVLIMCFGLSVQAQKFKIESKAISEITIFKIQPNDTASVRVLYKKEIVRMKLVIGIVRCTYSHNNQIERQIFKKILHYIYKDKIVLPKEILYSRRMNLDLIAGHGITLTSDTPIPWNR